MELFKTLLDSWRAFSGWGSTRRLIGREDSLVVERLETSSRRKRKRAKLCLYLIGREIPLVLVERLETSGRRERKRAKL